MASRAGSLSFLGLKIAVVAVDQNERSYQITATLIFCALSLFFPFSRNIVGPPLVAMPDDSACFFKALQ